MKTTPTDQEWEMMLLMIPEGVLLESSVVQHFIRRGFEQGARESIIEVILDVLEIRFQLCEVQTLKPMLECIPEFHRLKQLHRASVGVQNLEEFVRFLASEEGE